MKVRTNEEVSNIDSDLNLFEDTNWDFFGVLETQEPNYEYFDDVRDSSFDRNLDIIGQKLKFGLITGFVVCSFAIMSVIGLKAVGFFEPTDYDMLNNIQSIQAEAKSKYIKGNAVSDKDVQAITNNLTGYCEVLSSQTNYNQLYSYCKMTSSFADTYNSFTSKMQTSYDINDCYARSLRKYGSFCSVEEVTHVIEKDGVYYCYAKLRIPSKSTMYEYVYTNQHDFAKHFKSNDTSEEEIVRYMIESLDATAVPKSSQELCIKYVKNSNGEFKIIDDSIITSSCIDAYTECITQITNVIGNVKFN